MLFNLNCLIPSVINIIAINTFSARVYIYVCTMYNATYIKIVQTTAQFEFQRFHEARNRFNRDIDRDFIEIRISIRYDQIFLVFRETSLFKLTKYSRYLILSSK